MKSIKELENYIKRLFTIVKDNVRNEKIKAGKPEDFTNEDNEEINRRVCDFLVQDNLRTVDPAIIIDAYRAFLPGIHEVDADNERTNRHNNAVEAYAQAQVKTHGFFENHGIFEGLKGEENAEAEKNKKLQILADIKELAENKSYIIISNHTDDELIEKYPDLAPYIKLVPRAHDLIEELKKAQLEGVTEEQLNEYDRIIGSLSGEAALLENRMAVMADPYYTKMNLELLLETPLKELVQTGHEIQEKIEDASEDGISDDENIVNIANDIAAARKLEIETRIAAKMGIPVKELKDNIFLCDKDGNVAPSNSLLNELLTKGGAVYAVSKYGDKEPVPVLLDRNRPGFHPMVGAGAIADSAYFNPVRPTIGRWHRFLNAIWIKTSAMKNYEARMTEYNEKVRYDELKRMMSEEAVPAAVLNVINPLENRYKAIAAKKATYEKNIENNRVVMGNISDDQETLFDNALANMIINKALADNGQTKLRNTVFDVFKVFQKDSFSEEEVINTLKNNSGFKDFAWHLRKDYPNLVKDLKSSDPNEAKAALNTVCEMFQEKYQGKEIFVPVSDEYNNRIHEESVAEAQANALAEDRIVSDNERKSMEASQNNVPYWNNILSVYGGDRKIRPEWIKEVSDKGFYSVEDWQMMNNGRVNVSELNPEGIPIDEKTFAALAMMMSLHEPGFLNNKGLKTTSTFEDVVANPDMPGENTQAALKPVIEKDRAKLIDCLKNMDSLLVDKFAIVPQHGREALAGELAKNLHVFAERAAKFNWEDRKCSALAEVAATVMKFAEQHNMTELLKENGLTDRDIETINTAVKLGAVANDAFNAETELIHDNTKQLPLSEEQRLECLNKIMLLKAIQADAKTNADEKEFSETAKSVLTDSRQLKELSNAMLPEDGRKMLASNGSQAICSVVRCKGNDSLSGAWKESLKDKRQKEAAEKEKAVKEYNNARKEQLIKDFRDDAKAIEDAYERAGKIRDNAYKGLHPSATETWENVREVMRKNNNPLADLSLERTAGINLVLGNLLCKGYSLEDILDPTKLTEAKKAAVDELKEKLLAGDNKWVAEHLYNGMNKASDELEKLYMQLQNKEPAATQQDILDKLTQLNVLSSLAFDLNQEAGRSAIVEGFKGVVSEEQIAASEKRARLLGGIAYGIYGGLNAKSQCYRNVLGEGNNSPFFIISGALHWQFTRNNLMKKVVEDLNKTGKISEKLIESYHDVACNFTGLVDLHRETKNMISDFPVGFEKDPMVQAAFLPVAIAIHDGTEPNVVHISANNFVIEGVDKLAKRVKKSMQENRQQAQKNNAPEAKQEQKKGPQMV